jgi:hypothetical protein
MGDEEGTLDSVLARVAREDLGGLGPVDYAGAFAGLSRRQRRLRAPVGIAAALAVGICLGAFLGVLLGPASPWRAAPLDWRQASSQASPGEEMQVFLDELLAASSVEDYALAIDWE